MNILFNKQYVKLLRQNSQTNSLKSDKMFSVISNRCFAFVTSRIYSVFQQMPNTLPLAFFSAMSGTFGDLFNINGGIPLILLWLDNKKIFELFRTHDKFLSNKKSNIKSQVYNEYFSPLQCKAYGVDVSLCSIREQLF